MQPAAYLSLLGENSIYWGGMEEKSENYIFSLGKVGSGKTAFQNHLIRYLKTANENFTIEPADYGSERLLDEWASLWRDGKFAARTEAGQPKDYAFRVQPVRRHKDKPPLEFGFLEISGTDFESLPAPRTIKRLLSRKSWRISSSIPNGISSSFLCATERSRPERGRHQTGRTLL